MDKEKLLNEIRDMFLSKIEDEDYKKTINEARATLSSKPLRAIKEMDAARGIFEIVCEVEYNLTEFKSSNNKEHLDRIQELMTSFSARAIKILKEAGVAYRDENNHICLEHPSLALKSAFDYYHLMSGKVSLLGCGFSKMSIGEILELVETFARTQLKAFGWKVEGDVLPLRIIENRIKKMQNMN